MDELLINTVYSFILITVRFSGLFILTPLFSSEMIPAQLKVGLSLVCSFLLYPALFGEQLFSFPTLPAQLVFELVNELLIGIILGFTAYMIFSVFQMSGQFIDLRMGFTMMSVLDPFVGEEVPLMGQFKNILAIMIMLAINGHHYILQALVSSYQVLPMGHPIINHSLMEYMFRLSADVILIGFRLSLPLVATLFIVEFVFGLLARTVPQMNVFMLGFPIKILIGFFVLFLSIPFIVEMSVEIIHNMGNQLFNVLRIMR